MYKLPPGISPKILAKSDGWEYFHVEKGANNAAGYERLGFVHEKYNLVAISSAYSFANELSVEISHSGELSHTEPSTSMCLWVLNQMGLLDASEIDSPHIDDKNEFASRKFILRHCR